MDNLGRVVLGTGLYWSHTIASMLGVTPDRLFMYETFSDDWWYDTGRLKAKLLPLEKCAEL